MKKKAAPKQKPVTRGETPMSLFEQGIIHQDWASVIKGFAIMFGYAPEMDEHLPANNSEQLKMMVQDLHELVCGKTATEATEDEPETPARKKPARKKVAVKRRSAARDDDDDDEDDDEDEQDDEDEENDDDDDEDERPRRKRRRRLPAGANRFADMDDGESVGGDGVRCRTRTFSGPKGKNKFKDDGVINQNLIDETKKLSEKAKPKTYREEPQMVAKRCAGCRRKDMVPPEALMQGGLYRCNSCARGGAGS